MQTVLQSRNHWTRDPPVQRNWFNLYTTWERQSVLKDGPAKWEDQPDW